MLQSQHGGLHFVWKHGGCAGAAWFSPLRHGFMHTRGTWLCMVGIRYGGLPCRYCVLVGGITTPIVSGGEVQYCSPGPWVYTHV